MRLILRQQEGPHVFLFGPRRRLSLSTCPRPELSSSGGHCKERPNISVGLAAEQAGQPGVREGTPGCEGMAQGSQTGQNTGVHAGGSLGRRDSPRGTLKVLAVRGRQALTGSQK